MQNRQDNQNFRERSVTSYTSEEIKALYYGPHRLTFRAGTYLALIRMMAIADLVTALYGHSQLVGATYERLARTRQTLLDLICNDFDSPTGREALTRLRQAHQHLKVEAEDYRYVLATFFLEPLRWNEHFGAKKLSERELQILLTFWERVGHEMNIPDLPSQLSEWRQLQREYEVKHMRFSAEGHHLASMCLREVVKLSLPKGTRWLFKQVMLVTIDPIVRESLRIRSGSWYTTVLVRCFLVLAQSTRVK
jgi:ER-bound oxygenase mpaB/B'/Rubber oxygenase, catalytic domain